MWPFKQSAVFIRFEANENRQGIVVTDQAEDVEIQVELSNGVAEIRLNRPARLNSFTSSMHLSLRQTLKELEQSTDCRCLLLTGNGRGFCTGQDLNHRDPRKSTSRPDLEDTLTHQFNPLISTIRGLRMPVICAVNGVAAGAGANLALACDIVLAAESASFIQSFARVGLIPDAGGSWMLPRLVGEARAKAIAMTGKPVKARLACEWGMIWQVLPDDELLTAARQLANELAAGPTLGIAATKQAIQDAYQETFHQHLQNEARWQGELGRSNDYAEGVVSFLEKRNPDFTGT